MCRANVKNPDGFHPRQEDSDVNIRIDAGVQQTQSRTRGRLRRLPRPSPDTRNYLEKIATSSAMLTIVISVNACCDNVFCASHRFCRNLFLSKLDQFRNIVIIEHAILIPIDLSLLRAGSRTPSYRKIPQTGAHCG